MSRWVAVADSAPPVGVPVWVGNATEVGCSEFNGTDWEYCDTVLLPITHWQEFPC